MHPYGNATRSPRDVDFSAPSDELRIAVTFKKSGDGVGPTKFLPPLSTRSAEQFLPDALVVDQAIYQMSALGFRPTRLGRLSASIRGTRALFEQTFGTKLVRVDLD